MLRQPFVQESVVGAQKFTHASVLPHLALDKKQRLLQHGVAKIFIELRIQLRVGHDSGELVQFEPADGKIVHQSRRSWIAQHSPHLLFPNGFLL